MHDFYVKDKSILENLKSELSQRKFPYSVTIREPKKSRSINQNKYYWTLVNILSPHTGYSPDDLHDVLKVKFLGVREIQFKGNTYLIAKSTAGLTTKEFTEYLDKVHALGLELGVTLPQPNYWGY